MAGKSGPAINPSECNATALRKASRRVTNFYDTALKPCGLLSTQMSILAELASERLLLRSIAELAKAMAIDRSALSHNLNPLIRDGYVTVGTADTDLRRRHVILTEAGHQKFLEARELWKKAQLRFEELYGSAETSALRSTLKHIAYDDRLGNSNQ